MPLSPTVSTHTHTNTVAVVIITATHAAQSEPVSPPPPSSSLSPLSPCSSERGRVVQVQEAAAKGEETRLKHADPPH